jgi:hypothetical protein
VSVVTELFGSWETRQSSAPAGGNGPNYASDGRVQRRRNHRAPLVIFGPGGESRIMLNMTERVATAPVAAGGLIASYAVATASGSRPLGGLVLAACGLACTTTWLRRDGRRTATMLTVAGLGAFALSHVVGLILGAWPAVLLAAAAMGMLCWRASDSRHINLRAATGS